MKIARGNYNKCLLEILKGARMLIAFVLNAYPTCMCPKQENTDIDLSLFYSMLHSRRHCQWLIGGEGGGSTSKSNALYVPVGSPSRAHFTVVTYTTCCNLCSFCVFRSADCSNFSTEVPATGSTPKTNSPYVMVRSPIPHKLYRCDLYLTRLF